MIGKLPMVSRLKDGRLFTILRDPNGNPLPRVLENDCWVEAEGIGAGCPCRLQTFDRQGSMGVGFQRDINRIVVLKRFPKVCFNNTIH